MHCIIVQIWPTPHTTHLRDLDLRICRTGDTHALYDRTDLANPTNTPA